MTSASYFEALAGALRLLPDAKRAYGRMSQVFQDCLLSLTEASQLNFAGTFARLDYLLQEHQATRQLWREVNDTRVRLRRRAELSADQLSRYCCQDCLHLCHFFALVLDCDVPESLTQQLADLQTEHSFIDGTATPAAASPVAALAESMRVVVEHWDDELLYVRREEGDDALPALTRVCYGVGNRPYGFDWSYLPALLTKGSQLNLIRPREEAGVLYPELIIIEPDYLVNISSVAHCFTSYAESPLVELLNRIKPASNSAPIQLGNFAGQLLYEEIHQLPAEHTYNDSVRDFFRQNAVQLLDAGIDGSFHQDAQRQLTNIRRAIRETLPQQLSRFDSHVGIVEPSFYSEMLGLQGRMDYLQLDYRVLLEQKSGKGGYPYDGFRRPRHTEEHYVQLLLYMLVIRYNYREQYERNNRELHSFLLYSKYDESLLGLSFSSELIFRALRIRNELAALELRLTRPDEYRLLERLTPDSLNEKQDHSMLWQNYICPQLTELLAPIHKASPLERDYYFRFLTFIANEHMQSKVGSRAAERSGFAAAWRDSLDDKRQAGNIYDHLSLVSPAPDTPGPIELVTLRFAETDENDMANFRIGDRVMLYPYDADSEPDARRTMVLRCSVEEIRVDVILLRLNVSQADSRVFDHKTGCLWAIEHDFMDSSFGSLYRGMHAFLSAPQRRRDLLMLKRRPEVDPTLQLRGDYGTFNQLSLRVRQSRDFFLIIGPPGTGKTSFGMLNTLREELLDPQASVLVMSYTNRAVDEICSKLWAEDIPFVRIGGEQNCAPAYRSRLLSSLSQGCQRLDQLRDLIIQARVVVGTTSTLSGLPQLFGLRSFSLAIIDEASQILEPHLLGLLSAQHQGQPAIARFVMIGDHKQLPAVVQQSQEVSRVSERSLLDIGLIDCRLSLFERLLRRYADDPTVTYMLTHQGRMHQEIAAWPSQMFYEGKLQVVPGRDRQVAALPGVDAASDRLSRLLLGHRVAFVDCQPPEVSPSDKVNMAEAELIATMVHRISELEGKQFDPDRSVGVIVPYRNQIATIRNVLSRYDDDRLTAISIDTVERYQGSQRRYIIYGFTIHQPYQLKFLTGNTFVDEHGYTIDRKLNVAMTRAEEHLILVGHAALLRRDPVFAALIASVPSVD